ARHSTVRAPRRGSRLHPPPTASSLSPMPKALLRSLRFAPSSRPPSPVPRRSPPRFALYAPVAPRSIATWPWSDAGFQPRGPHATRNQKASKRLANGRAKVTPPPPVPQGQGEAAQAAACCTLAPPHDPTPLPAPQAARTASL